MPALSTATESTNAEPPPGRQHIAGVVTGISWEPPSHGALGIVWVAIVPGSTSILDVRGLVLWPGTAIVTPRASGSRPGGSSVPKAGDRIRACASEAEYWSIPPIFDTARIELLGP